MSAAGALDVVRQGLQRKVTLTPMTPRQQLRAGQLPRRVVQLVVGLSLFGASLALLLRAGLGVEPWGVLHFGLIQYLPFTYGQISIAVSLIVLLLWIPLRQSPGLGTVLNVFVIGLAIDATLAVVPAVHGLGWQVLVLIIAVLGNGLASAMYIGSQLGPGARDGLMTGLHARTGISIRVARTAIEVTVVALGWALGGIVGVGTVVFALCIGPVVQALLPIFTVNVRPPASDLASGSDQVDQA